MGIIGGLVFTGISLRDETKARRVANILTITAQHREIWGELYERPELARILEAKVNLKKHPSTPAETLFVRFIILHTLSVFRAIKSDEVLKADGTDEDVHEFFALPIPHAVWLKYRKYQDRDFVAWVDEL